MAELNDIDTISFGGQSIGAAYIGGDMIWPTAAIVWELIPVWVGSLSVAASGGSATATWTLTGRRNGTTVYSSTVTPTSAQLGDQTNFHYNISSGEWSADNRGTNNYTSGTNPPTQAQMNAPKRTCGLTVNYQGTVTVGSSTESVNVDSAAQTMTQAANIGRYISNSNIYDQFSASLRNYGSQSSPAPASQASTTADASCRCGNYISWDSGSHAYYYQTLQTAMFVFSSVASWISINGSTITAATRGTTIGNDKRSATITAQLNQSYYPGITNTATATMWQDVNVVTGYNYRNVSLSALTSNPATLICTTTQFTVSGTLAGDKQEVFSSTATGNWTPFSETVHPTVTSATGATSFSGATVNIAANSTDSTKTITVGAKYTLNSTSYTASKAFTQGAVTYTYGLPIVTITYPFVSGQSYHIGAADGYVIPSVSFRQQRTNDVSGATTDITGTYTFGSDTSRRASDGSTFTVSFSGSTSITGASFNATSGRVDAPSRQTTDGSERNITANAKATIVSHEQSGASSSATVKQRANAKGNQIPASCSSVVISSLSPSSINTCAATTVTATVLASWTEAGYKYTSYYDGDTTNGYTGLTPHNNESVTGRNGVTLYVNGSPVQSNTNQFSVNKVHSESTADHSVYANYMSVNSGTSYISQTPDAKSAWQSRGWTAEVAIGNNQIWAGGGQAAIVASGSHEEYKTWTDGSDAETRTITTDTPSLSLVNANNDNAYTGTAYSIVGTELRHRDMENNGTTDSVRVMATNASASKKTGTISVTNNRSSVPEYGPWHDYGSSYAGNYAVDTFTAGAYTSSSSPAPRIQATTTYSVTASHDTLIHQAKDAYYYYDSNYASAHGGTDDHNDADHRDTVANADTSGTPRVVSHHTGDSVTFSYPTGQTWLTAAGGTITIAAQSQLGDAPRDGYIFATNGGASKNVRIYQAPYAGFSVSQTSFMFPAEGGTYYTDVTAYYAAWDIHYIPASTDPGVIFTAAGESYGTASGGNDNAVTTTRVTLTVSAYSQPGEPTEGEATLDARTRSEVPPVTITLKQYAQTS